MRCFFFDEHAWYIGDLASWEGPAGPAASEKHRWFSKLPSCDEKMGFQGDLMRLCWNFHGNLMGYNICYNDIMELE